MIRDEHAGIHWLYLGPNDLPDDLTKLPSQCYVRTEILSEDISTAVRLESACFFFADRTLHTAIILAKLDDKIAKLCRFSVEVDTYSPDINMIAERAFLRDRRFHLTREPDIAIAGAVLARWIHNSSEAGHTLLTCRHNGKRVGFMILSPYGEAQHFVELAAVLPEYQSTGMALALYYNACIYCRDHGDKKVHGRISSANTTVINLYSRLGANFSVPYDVFIRERKA